MIETYTFNAPAEGTVAEWADTEDRAEWQSDDNRLYTYSPPAERERREAAERAATQRSSA